MLDSELKSKINQLWDKFWSGGISNPLQAIEQISYLIFIKRLEDEENSREQNAALKGEKYQTIFLGKDGNYEENYRWSKWTTFSSNQILDHVRDEVFPFLRRLGGEESLYGKYMKDAVFTIPTASLLIEAVKIINDMHIKEQNRDTQGDIYEYLLSELRTSGKNGQFRTPRHIIGMMVELIEPKVGEKIADPACGTAGFLVRAYEYILKIHTSKEFIQTYEDSSEGNFKADKLSVKEWDFLKSNALYGFDFDPTMVRISLMNLMMHGITNPNIKLVNTLSTRYNEENCYDVVLANLPFKGSIDKSEINDDFTVSTTKTEILFLELIYKILKIGGRCAVIVPDGVLFGNSKAHKQIRQKLLEKCRLDAIISMPSGVFKPYAGVSTGILVFTKGEPTSKVWFYDMEADGYSLDDKRTFIDGKGEIPDIVEKFKKRGSEKFDDRKAKCFFVPFEEIKKNDYDLSISKYREIEYEETEYEDPEVILLKIGILEDKIKAGIDELMENLKECT